MVKDWFAAFGDAVGKHIVPLVNTRLDLLQRDVMAKVDEWVDEAREDMIERIPEIAIKLAEGATRAVLDNTQIGEAADEAIDIVRGFFDHFRDGLKGLPGMTR